MTVNETAGRRRRGAELEAAIFQAVWDELGEGGYANLTVTAVAERAGTSKPVLYRRWPSRARIVYAALAHPHLQAAAGVPDTGSLRGDLISLMEAMARNTENLNPETLWGLLSESVNDAELASAVRADLLDPAPRQALSVVVERAIERGEIDRVPLTPRQLGLPFELMRTEALTAGSITPTAIREIVDDIVLPLLRQG